MTDHPTYRYENLTARQQAFVDAYLGRTYGGKGFLNTYQAASLAGYAKNRSNPYAQVKDNKRVSAVIKVEMDRMQMRDNEAAMIHARLSTATLAPFLKIHLSGLVEIDLSSDEAKANLHLLKKIKQKKTVRQYEEVNPETGEVSKVTRATIEHDIEIHDPGQNAERIRRAHGAYGATGRPGDPILLTITGVNFKVHSNGEKV